LIAVAKTSQPIVKSFDRETLIKIKLSFWWIVYNNVNIYNNPLHWGFFIYIIFINKQLV
jgi:hypothetical protein